MRSSRRSSTLRGRRSTKRSRMLERRSIEGFVGRSIAGLLSRARICAATPNALNRFAAYERTDFAAMFVANACKLAKDDRVARPDQLNEVTIRAIWIPRNAVEATPPKRK